MFEAIRVYLTREKLHQRGSRFAWSWLYSVQLPGEQPVAIGTSLASATTWAKQRAPGVAIIRAWETIPQK